MLYNLPSLALEGQWSISQMRKLKPSFDSPSKKVVLIDQACGVLPALSRKGTGGGEGIFLHREDLD